MKIWKFNFDNVYQEEFTIFLPIKSRIIHIEEWVGPCMWVICDPIGDEVDERIFKIVGTGDSWTDQWVWVGTWLDGEFVWHLLEKREQ